MTLLGGVSPVTVQEPSEARPANTPILTGTSGNYKASIFINVSPKQAWSILTRYETMPKHMPDIKDAKIISRSSKSLRIRQIYQAPYTFGLRIAATLQMQEDPPNKLSYQLISSDSIRSLKGVWTITPAKKGIMLTHQIRIDPIVPAFVRPLYDELSESNLKQSMSILKQLMEAEHP